MLKPRTSLFSSLLAACVLAGPLACTNDAPTTSRHGPPHKASPTASAARDEYPLIVRIVGRHQTITVTAGPAGPLYTAKASDGRLLVASATLEELRDNHPDVYRQLNPGIAVESDRNDGPRPASSSTPPLRTGEPVSSADPSAPLMLMSAE